VPLLVRDDARALGGALRTITIDRPDKRNALDDEHLAALAAAFSGLDAQEVRAVVVTGSGTAFCAGYDLGRGGAITDAAVMRAMEAVRACAVPVLAVVNGPAFGAGLELALSADTRLAAPGASFCLPSARLGIAYAPRALARLVALVGTGVARRMLFTAEVVPADRALQWGLVEELASPDALPARSLALAESLASLAPLAVRAMKRTFDALEPAPAPGDLVPIEAERLAAFGSDDAREGLAAHLARRPPRYSGR
jgi:enoyl-CoA hydratase/carnithine racemase